MILYLADLHFGKVTHSKMLPEGDSKTLELFRVLCYTIKMAVTKGCTHLVIAGDIFNDNVSTSFFRKIFNEFLYIAIGMFKCVYILKGNHDHSKTSASALEPIKSLQLDGVMVIDKIEAHMILGVNHIFVPHINPEEFNQEEKIEEISKLIDLKVKNVLVGHYHAMGSVVGAERLMLNGGENNYDIASKGIDRFILGHIHKPQDFKIGGVPAHYIGSPTYNDFGERNDEKRFIMLDPMTFVIKSCLVETRKYIQFKYNEIPEWAKDSIVKITDVPRDVNEQEIKEIFVDAHYLVIEYCKNDNRISGADIDDSKSDVEIFTDYLFGQSEKQDGQLIEKGTGIINEIN